MLLDAGTHPKHEGRESLPLYKLIAKVEVEAIALTHCHHDHVGSLPVALRHFPKAHVLMTELSYFLIERVLHNSVNVMTRQRDELGIKEYPLYSHDEVDEIAALFQGFRYSREVEWGAYQKTRAGLASPTLEFYDAGHALGSAGVMVRGQKETLFYTGDVCFGDQTLLRGARFDEVKADVLIMVVLEPGQVEKMGLAGGRIFVLTAGMMSEHTAAHDLAARMIGDERQAIFFVGYADPDTPGGRLKAAKPGAAFVMSGSAGEVTKRCEVLDFDLTAHANRDELLDFVGQIAPRAVLLGHGEAESRNWFEQQIRARHPKIKIIQPEPGKSAVL